MIKRSEYISNFLNFLEQAKADYISSADGVKTEDKRQEDLVHKIEFSTNCKERNKLTTKLHKCRKVRREYKDIYQEVKPVYEFATDPVNKKVIDKMTQMLGQVRKEERYHEDRVYKPRLKEGE